MSAAAEIEDRAARWLLRREREDWSQADEAGLEAWLDEAPEHRVAFYRLEHGWAKAGRLAALRSPDGAPPAPRPWPAQRPLWAVAASLAAALVLGLSWAPLSKLMGPAAKTYATAVGSRETVPLVDGSKVEINTDTTLRAQVSAAKREVWLDNGEAYFQIAHDPAHPFVVHAGDRRITVLGTKFSVRRDGDRVRVAVVEGRVKVEAAGSPSVAPAIATRGDVVVGKGSLTLVAVKPVELISEELSWRHGQLFFDQATLQDVAAEFNRYNRRKLVVDPSVTGDVRIGGSFEAENVETFARLLRDAYGLKVVDREDQIVVSR